MTILSTILSSKARAEIFAILFSGQDLEMHNRAIQKLINMSEYATRTELQKLARVNLLKTRKDGNRRYYKANCDHPLYNAIKELIEKSVGYKAILHDALKRPEISVVFVFGSYAAGSPNENSDIDLFIVGKIGMRTISKILSTIESRICREINVHIFTRDELKAKHASGDHFINSVLKTKKEFIVGNEDDLKAMV